jgi:hypothetical protein
MRRATSLDLIHAIGRVSTPAQMALSITGQ